MTCKADKSFATWARNFFFLCVCNRSCKQIELPHVLCQDPRSKSLKQLSMETSRCPFNSPAVRCRFPLNTAHTRKIFLVLPARLKIHWLYFLLRGKTSPLSPIKRGVLDIILNCIGWWDSSSGDLRNVKYTLIAITLRFSLARSRSTC